MSVSKAKCCYTGGGGLRGTNNSIMRRKLRGKVSLLIRPDSNWAKNNTSYIFRNSAFWVNCQKSFSFPRVMSRRFVFVFAVHYLCSK